jgi:two-component system, NarL family, nitrate/nitrite response regulator NarL
MEPVSRAPTPITVLVAVAVRLYRDGLASLLTRKKHLLIAASAGTPTEIQAAARQLQPDVIVLDVSLENVRTLMRALRAESSGSHILAFAVREDISTILDYAEAGAEGFFTANGSVADLAEAIERTAAGELMCSPKIAAELLRRATDNSKNQLPANEVTPILTVRQQQVLSLLKEGRSNKQISAVLHIAEATVKNHVHQILQKLQVTTRARAVAIHAPRVTVDPAKRTSPLFSI